MHAIKSFIFIKNKFLQSKNNAHLLGTKQSTLCAISFPF